MEARQLHDVLGSYQRLERLYRTYIGSAFPLRSPQLTRERDELLSEREILSQEPLIETVPVYESSGLDLRAATARLDPSYAGLASLAAALFPPGRELYAHQWEALHEVIAAGKDF